MPITFTRRARIRKSELSRQRSWTSTDGRYKITEVSGLVGHYFLAIRRLVTGEYVFSQNRTRAAAERACAKHRGS